MSEGAVTTTEAVLLFARQQYEATVECILTDREMFDPDDPKGDLDYMRGLGRDLGMDFDLMVATLGTPDERMELAEVIRSLDAEV